MKAGHFTGIDGMRGIAAIAVLMFHLGGLSGLGFAAHGYLAVDFFFMLSGFVIARAYEQRLMDGRLSALSYVAKRLVRLYPVVFLGLMIGMAVHVSGGDKVTPAWALSFVFLPLIGTTLAYPLNNVLWSLALEIAINGLHAISARRLTVLRLSVMIAIAATALIWVAVSASGLNVGWTFAHGQSLAMRLGGIPRVFFGFGLGVLLFRIYDIGRLPALPIAWPLAAIILAVVLLAPFPHRAAYDLTCLFVVFPALLVAGVSTSPSSRLQPVAAWLGAISYPLYAIHYPLVERTVRLQQHRFTSFDASLLCYLFASVGIVLLAHLVASFFDLRIVGTLNKRRTPALATIDITDAAIA